jgi:hypothetical protein
MAVRSVTSLRYYLWAKDGPWRITHQLHSDLVSGKVALRQYAGTKQKIVEVFIRKVRGRPVIVEARGTFYCFDARGRLDVSSQAEAAAIAVDGSKARAVQDNVFDIGPAVRHHRWTDEHIWKPSTSVLREISADLEVHSRAPRSPGPNKASASSKIMKLARR